MNATDAGNRILLIGGTGAMGVPVLKHLLADPNRQWMPRILTRNPQSKHAQSLLLLDPRIELVRGDVANSEAVSSALEDVSGVFCNTDYWSLWDSSGNSMETSIGIKLLELARRANVEYFIYSSAEDTEGLSGGRFCAAHFDAKAKVEKHILDKRLGGDAWYLNNTSILRTAPYMENFQTYFLPQKSDQGDGTFNFILPIGKQDWTMVALDDIGWFAAHLFSNAEQWKGRDLAIASDRLSLAEIAEAFTDVTGIPAHAYAPSDEEFLSWGIEGSDDLLNMFRFVREVGLERDIDSLRSIHPGLLDFRTWLGDSGWKGEARKVQVSLLPD